VTTVGLFTPKVPTTVSDQQMADLRRRAERANTESMFSRSNVERRKASNRQKDNADNN
jgi:hypothetical protein